MMFSENKVYFFQRCGFLGPLQKPCSMKFIQFFMCFFADLMNRPKALSFFRLSRYDIS